MIMRLGFDALSFKAGWGEALSALSLGDTGSDFVFTSLQLSALYISNFPAFS